MVVQNDRGATAQLPCVAAELGWGSYEEYALSQVRQTWSGEETCVKVWLGAEREGRPSAAGSAFGMQVDHGAHRSRPRMVQQGAETYAVHKVQQLWTEGAMFVSRQGGRHKLARCKIRLSRLLRQQGCSDSVTPVQWGIGSVGGFALASRAVHAKCGRSSCYKGRRLGCESRKMRGCVGTCRVGKAQKAGGQGAHVGGQAMHGKL